jgi:hypothetical protein
MHNILTDYGILNGAIEEHDDDSDYGILNGAIEEHDDDSDYGIEVDADGYYLLKKVSE